MLMCSGLNMDGDGVIIHSVASGLPLHKQDKKKKKKTEDMKMKLASFFVDHELQIKGRQLHRLVYS